VLTDVIDELEIAVASLCQRPKHDGSKRRRVDDSESDDSSVDDTSAVSPLQPLLLCLEAALKADAHEGGDWARGDDNQRYNMILSHLGKLLMAHVPKDLPLSSDLSQKEESTTSPYQKLVEGQGTLEHGNVVGCLTALAAAAGNEQLWKPLNFAVLEACSHKRSEVRRAGISCLLSIIETVGEEYMVLLPECLPVLSELLEDSDEDIAGMAKECVRQGEELLGESLEDSLR
jgi:U3 small nucleolar RNA-associated protein 10